MFKTSAPPAEELDHVENHETLGGYLKNARIVQGLNIDTIASETRINSNSLIALEENNRADLPADVFSRGFVKIYATYLKLDPQEALRLYEKQWGATPSFDPFAVSKPRSGLAPGIVITLLLIAFFFAIRIYYPGEQGEPLAPATMNGVGTGIDMPATAPAPAANSPSTGPEGEQPESEPVRPPMDVTEATPADADIQPQTAEPPTTPPYNITLHAAGPTTIKLSLDGRDTIEKTMPAGASESWQAEKEFDLTLDHGSGVTLRINEVPVAIEPEAGKPVTIHRP